MLRLCFRLGLGKVGVLLSCVLVVKYTFKSMRVHTSGQQHGLVRPFPADVTCCGYSRLEFQWAQLSKIAHPVSMRSAATVHSA
jgi:hypothetical protein